GLTEQDVAAAAPSIFHLPDGEQVRHRKTAVDKFLARAPFEVLGQERAIQTIGARMKSHVLGVRDVDRPLALLLPGPTGVGKTELTMKFALAMNMPFFDAGILTAGNGETVRRPGHVIVGAANAGAERLHRHMSERQVKDVLAEAFTDRQGNRRPELVRRFEAVPMLALEREHFVALLR